MSPAVAGEPAAAGKPPHYDQYLAGGPTNWGRWGEDDEIGTLNLLDAQHVLGSMSAVRQGRVLTLGLPFADPAGDPVWPDRIAARRTNVRDRGTYAAGKAQPAAGGMEFADDVLYTYLQGTTHADALAHTWYGGQTYNGFDADSTVGALARASVFPLAQKGIVGRGVLIDLPRHRAVDRLGRHDPFTLEELLAAASGQGVPIQPRDILLVRTGWLDVFYEEGAAQFYQRPFHEPGLLYEPAVPRWFQQHEIVAYGTDTVGNEYTVQPETGLDSPMHASLMRNLGVVFMELLDLRALAADCARDGQWDFLFVGSPLKVVGGTGGPMNPIVIK